MIQKEVYKYTPKQGFVLTHFLTVADIKRSAEFYLRIFGGSTDSAIRHIIHRFSDKASRDAWENSEELTKLIEEANNYCTRYYKTSTDLET